MSELETKIARAIRAMEQRGFSHVNLYRRTADAGNGWDEIMYAPHNINMPQYRYIGYVTRAGTFYKLRD